MRRRDWAGTVLVACLIALAGLLRDQGLLARLLIAAAVVSSGIILWDIRPTLSRWLKTARSRANGSLSAPESRQRPSTETTKPAGECDAQLRTLLVAGQNVSDSYQWNTSFSRQWDEATRREHLLWTRDAITLVRHCYPAVAEKFEAASSHQKRMAILADLLGNEEE